MNEWSFFCLKWLTRRRQNSRWLPSSKLSENEWCFSQIEWVWVRVLCKMAESKVAEFMMDAIIRVESDWMSEVFFESRWLTRRKQKSRWLTSSSWVRSNQFESDWISLSQSFVQNGWIQDGSGWIQHGRIQDGCHHQVEWEWMSKVFLCKMAESKMVEFKMAAIITLSQN